MPKYYYNDVISTYEDYRFNMSAILRTADDYKPEFSTKYNDMINTLDEAFKGIKTDIDEDVKKAIDTYVTKAIPDLLSSIMPETIKESLKAVAWPIEKALFKFYVVPSTVPSIFEL